VPSGTRTYGFIPAFESWASANNKTILGRLPKGINWPCQDVKLTSVVAINEPTLVQPVSVVETLNDLARLAQSIIKLFDI
jgi:hypothetical protein